MKTSDFDYPLPEERIAYYPAAERDRCNLLVLHRDTGDYFHHSFMDLPGLLRPGDRLVMNDTRVIPARVRCRKQSGGRVEILFTGSMGTACRAGLVRASRPVREGTRVFVEKEPEIWLEAGEVLHDGERHISLIKNKLCDSIDAVCEKYGEVPLPPYIKRESEPGDAETYQTIFARNAGAVAAPTAGLHFSRRCMKALRERGIHISYLTLHVGTGTFRPVKTEDPDEHVMHEERYVLPRECAGEIEQTRRQGGRIIAVGTTVVRVLEHCARESNGSLEPSSGSTHLFIRGEYRFRIIDGMITNFHWPRSTLLMLVCAFGGRDRVLAAYGSAIRKGYRFFSYGDAMLIF